MVLVQPNLSAEDFKTELHVAREVPSKAEEFLEKFLGPNPIKTAAGESLATDDALRQLGTQMNRCVDKLEEMNKAPPCVRNRRFERHSRWEGILDYTGGEVQFLYKPKEPKNCLVQIIRTFWLQNEFLEMNKYLASFRQTPWINISEYEKDLAKTVRQIVSCFVDPQHAEAVVMDVGSRYRWKKEYTTLLNDVGKEVLKTGHGLQDWLAAAQEAKPRQTVFARASSP
jgi:hypothetical protein